MILTIKDEWANGSTHTIRNNYSATLYNMTIIFTRGWMTEDDDYMEQEFNSL